MTGERITYIFSDMYGDARPSNTTSATFKIWKELCKTNPTYSVYCLDFLGDVIGELEEQYEYFSIL